MKTGVFPNLSRIWRHQLAMFSLFSMTALLGFAVSAPLRAQEKETLRFGVFPYVSAQQIVRNFTPLKELIAEITGRPVTLESAADYPTFYQNTRQGEYDVIFTAPHLGRIAETESRYQRIAISAYRVSNAIVVLKDSPIRSIQDLRGKAVALPTRWAFVHQTGRAFLREQGLDPERDVKLREVSTNPDTVFALIRGDVDAAITGRVNWLEHREKDKTRLLAETSPIQGFLVMANPRLSPDTVTRLRTAFVNFDKTAAGKAYFEKTRHVAFMPVTNEQMKALDPYTSIQKAP